MPYKLFLTARQQTKISDFEEKSKEELPRKEMFYSSLTSRKISSKECEHALNVWKKFEMKTMKDYHDLHLLKVRRFIISWCVWKFRNNNLMNYGVCPSDCLSAPGLSWDAMLKMTKIDLERIPDPNMY